MARIDPLIRHLYEFGADAIGIGSGHQVVLVAGGARRPITAAPMPLAQVEAILSEVVPATDIMKVRQQGVHQVEYSAADGTVEIEVHRSGGDLRLVVRPSKKAEPPPAAPDSGGFDALPQTGVTQIPEELRQEALRTAASPPPTEKFDAVAAAAQSMPAHAATAPPIASAPPPDECAARCRTTRGERTACAERAGCERTTRGKK